MKPAHSHDCSGGCRFYGTVTFGDVAVDVYCHDHPTDGTVSLVLRYSSDGPDYWSFLHARPEPTTWWQQPTMKLPGGPLRRSW